MNPDEFSWTEDQQVTVTNPTAQPYKFKVHGKDYEVGAGKTVKMAGFIAWNYVYGLAQTMAVEDGQFANWNDELVRKQYYEKLTVGADELVQAVEVEEPQLTEVPGSGSNYVSPFEQEKKPETDTEAGAKRGRPSKV